MSRSMIALPLLALAISLIACFSDSDEPAEVNNDANNDMNNTPEPPSILVSSVGYEVFPGIGGDTIAVGSLLQLQPSASPVDPAAEPTEVSATSADEAIVEVVRVTSQLAYANAIAEEPERQVPIIEVRGKAVGKTTITVVAKYKGVPVSATYNITVGQPATSRLSPWCIERDAGSNLDARGALPGETIWFKVELNSEGETSQTPIFYRGSREGALVVTPASAATPVLRNEYASHYGLRVAEGATEFTVESAPNTQTNPSDYKVVAEGDIKSVQIAGGTAILGIPVGQAGVLSWSSSTEDRYLCGQAEEATISVTTPTLCDASLVVGEVEVRDAMGRAAASGFWVNWHPQKAIRVEGKAAGECVVELTLPNADGGAGIKTPITIPIQ